MASKSEDQHEHPAPTIQEGHKDNQPLSDTAIFESKTIERVFPIRIHDTLKRAPKDATVPVALSSLSLESPAGKETQTIEGFRLPTPDNESGAPLVSSIRFSEADFNAGTRYITSRFNYVPGAQNQPTAPNTNPRVYRCEDEPIHIPGAVQSFGALLAIREDGDFFLVRIASENSKDIIGMEPELLFQLRCFTNIIDQKDQKEFTSRAHALYANLESNNLDVFTLSLTTLTRRPSTLFCAMHRNTGSDYIICEFEPERSIASNEGTQISSYPDSPIQVVDNQATDAERLDSTTRKSQPLRALEIARSNLRYLHMMDMFQIITEIQNQQSAATELSHLFDVTVGMVQELTAFHRVMIYKFDETAAGSVVSEIINPRASKDIFKGLHFPAADIPKQARELYMTNTIRILYDREQETARLVCRTWDDAKEPLDLKHSYLRAMSPIHLKYLANMGVQASMSISLIVDNKLWGLISCHNYGSGSGAQISLPTREICRGLGRATSSNIQKLLLLNRIKVRRLLASPVPKASPFAYIASSTSDLLSMFGADLGFLVIRGEARTIGTLFAYNESIHLLQYIRQRRSSEIYSSHALSRDLTDLGYKPGLVMISGMLVIPLSESSTDFLVFFRKGKIKEIRWAGNPYEAKVAAGTEYLEPRSSFKRWSENVFGTSREWTEDEVESAAILRSLYTRFIDVWRQKEAIVQRNRMTRLLIRNAGHEVRTPLNSIINYLEVALEETLDETARFHLQKSLQASKSMVFVVNDLLQLTEAEDADFEVYVDNVDLRTMLSEVIAAFKANSSKNHVQIEVQDDNTIPQFVLCDPSGMRQVISNLFANALQNSSSSGHIIARLRLLQADHDTAVVEISFIDDGVGLTEKQLDSIFRDFEQILDDSNTPPHEQPAAESRQALQIGLGLATVARFVRIHSGQISMSSDGYGKGTKVSITIPFKKPLRLNPRSMAPDLAILTSSLRTERNVTKPKGNEATSTKLTPLTVPESVSAAMSLSSPEASTSQYPFPGPSTTLKRNGFNVLVAEDNPLNSRLLQARLEKKGHTVKLAVDGKVCADMYLSNAGQFDVILMDIQMPIMDGIEATRLIRSMQREPSEVPLSPRVVPYGRIPIVAVSASLSEQRVQEYMEVGFDGWILKPIDFRRLEAILSAIEDEQTRQVLLYGQENWEKGGWFRIASSEAVEK